MYPVDQHNLQVSTWLNSCAFFNNSTIRSYRNFNNTTILDPYRRFIQ